MQDTCAGVRGNTNEWLFDNTEFLSVTSTSSRRLLRSPPNLPVPLRSERAGSDGPRGGSRRGRQGLREFDAL